LALVCTTHPTPFHPSASVTAPAEPVPAATQAVELAHETAARAPLLAAGVGTIAQLTPFQRSAKPWVVCPSPDVPTAMQAFGAEHDTPFRELVVVLAALRAF
jgi:hypothetical protein